MGRKNKGKHTQKHKTHTQTTYLLTHVQQFFTEQRWELEGEQTGWTGLMELFSEGFHFSRQSGVSLPSLAPRFLLCRMASLLQSG